MACITETNIACDGPFSGLAYTACCIATVGTTSFLILIAVFFFYFLLPFFLLLDRNDELEGSGSGDWDGNALEANAGAEDYSAVDNYECPKSSMPQHECQKREMAINATCILPTKASITIPSTFSSYHLRTAFYSGELSACFNETRNRETGQNIWSAEELAPWKACSSVSRSPNDLCGTKGQFAAATVDTWGVGCGRKHVSCMASRTDSRCKPTCVDKSGVHPDGTPSSPPNPVAIPCEDGKLKSKYHAEGGPAQWTGFDVALLTDLTGAGGMTFEIISMGSAFEISQRNVHRNITIPQSGQASGSVETLKGYTAEAHEMMKCECVDMFGQGTWRTNLQRVTKLGYAWPKILMTHPLGFLVSSRTLMGCTDPLLSPISVIELTEKKRCDEPSMPRTSSRTFHFLCHSFNLSNHVRLPD